MVPGFGLNGTGTNERRGFCRKRIEPGLFRLGWCSCEDGSHHRPHRGGMPPKSRLFEQPYCCAQQISSYLLQRPPSSFISQFFMNEILTSPSSSQLLPPYSHYIASSSHHPFSSVRPAIFPAPPTILHLWKRSHGGAKAKKS